MRLVRRASLVFSLVLIVAIVVGFVVRHAELGSERDLKLTTAAQLGSIRLASLVDTTAVASQIAIDPAAVAASIVAVHPEFGVCAVSIETVSCAGSGPIPTSAATGARQRDRAENADLSDRPYVTVYDAILSIDVDGPLVSLIVQAPADAVSSRGGYVVNATTLLPSGVGVGEFSVGDGFRQTTVPVDRLTGVYVTARGVDAVSLPEQEHRFYIIVFTLAAILLVLAGVTLLIEQRSLLERASFDPLTKLPNRGEFERRAAEAIASAERREHGIAFLLFDLNGFKLVNDTYGHSAGDDILREVGARLRKAVRDDDIVARWGGDEFVVAMPGIATEEMANRRARQLAEQICGRTRIEGIDDPIRVKASVGAALWPSHGADLEALIEAADHAMYRAKRDGLVCALADTVTTRPPAGTVV
ncbi:MAG: GGDEF domain-containing protein [Ilumatobacteraceae bacterium]